MKFNLAQNKKKNVSHYFEAIRANRTNPHQKFADNLTRKDKKVSPEPQQSTLIKNTTYSAKISNKSMVKNQINLQNTRTTFSPTPLKVGPVYTPIKSNSIEWSQDRQSQSYFPPQYPVYGGYNPVVPQNFVNGGSYTNGGIYMNEGNMNNLIYPTQHSSQSLRPYWMNQSQYQKQQIYKTGSQKLQEDIPTKIKLPHQQTHQKQYNAKETFKKSKKNKLTKLQEITIYKKDVNKQIDDKFESSFKDYNANLDLYLKDIEKISNEVTHFQAISIDKEINYINSILRNLKIEQIPINLN